jgi:hypothetical protein
MVRKNGSGQPLTEDERAALSRLRNRHGEEKAARLVGVSMSTLARAAAGFGLQKGTRLLIRVRLAELPQEAA